MSKKLRLAVLVSGGGTNLQAIIDGIADGSITNTEIAAVISNNPGVGALDRAARAGVPAFVLSPKEYESRAVFNTALQEKIDSLGVDLIVLAGCLLKIPESLVEAYPNRIINIHPALIPAFCGKGYYGLKVHEEALKRGVKLTGATVHFVNADLDAGPIILQKAVAVQEGDTPEILQRRVMEEAEWKIMPEAINLIANGCITVEGMQVHIQ
ncbi:MAG: phosphoribosylglycinamide formyltransferase [Lachnospiraceae bacterium]|nr:phosphoribosylglycinamide formyltransferase [Lachnospiraceae bacterium]